MDKNIATNKIKENLKSLMKFAQELGLAKDKKFGTYELTDGTKITCDADDLAVDVIVSALDDQGNKTPLDPGTYELTDGRSFEITGDDSTISTMTVAGKEDPQAETETPADTLEQKKEEKMEDGIPDEETETEAPASSDKDVESRIADLESQLAEILNLLNKMGDSGATQNEVNEQMMSKLIELANEPGEEPISLKKKSYEMYDRTSAKSKVSHDTLLELREEIKKRREGNLNFNLR